MGIRYNCKYTTDGFYYEYEYSASPDVALNLRKSDVYCLKDLVQEKQTINNRAIKSNRTIRRNSNFSKQIYRYTEENFIFPLIDICFETFAISKWKELNKHFTSGIRECDNDHNMKSKLIYGEEI